MTAPVQYRAMIATLTARTPTDDPEFTLTSTLTRWGLLNMTTGQPVTTGEPGPTFIDVKVTGQAGPRRYAMEGQPGESMALWLTDDLDACIRKVRTVRGILHIGRHLVYDLTRWAHLTDEFGRGGTCWRCGAEVRVYGRTGRRATVDGENYDCPGQVWFPPEAAAQASAAERKRYGTL